MCLMPCRWPHQALHLAVLLEEFGSLPSVRICQAPLARLLQCSVSSGKTQHITHMGNIVPCLSMAHKQEPGVLQYWVLIKGRQSSQMYAECIRCIPLHHGYICRRW